MKRLTLVAAILVLAACGPGANPSSDADASSDAGTSDTRTDAVAQTIYFPSAAAGAMRSASHQALLNAGDVNAQGVATSSHHRFVLTRGTP